MPWCILNILILYGFWIKIKSITRWESGRVCVRVNNTEIDIVYYATCWLPFWKMFTFTKFLSKIYVKRWSWHASSIALLWHSKINKNSFTCSCSGIRAKKCLVGKSLQSFVINWWIQKKTALVWCVWFGGGGVRIALFKMWHLWVKTHRRQHSCKNTIINHFNKQAAPSTTRRWQWSVCVCVFLLFALK